MVKTQSRRVRDPNLAQAVNSGYSSGGASHRKTTLAAYNPLKSSPQADVDVNLTTLRARSYDLYCNSPLGAAANNRSRANVVGAGLRCSPKVDFATLGMTAEAAKEWQRKTLREFELWANSTSCDLYRKHNFYDLQDIAYLGQLLDGDAWAALKYRKPTPNMPYTLRVQIFEAARVCNPNSVSAYGPLSYYDVEAKNPDNGNRILNGVEMDEDGAVVAYWVANRIPFDLINPMQPLEWSRVEAYGKRTGRPNVLQISHEERPEQYRGVPYLAPVIETLKQISRYTGAELTAAIIKSFFTLFFTSEDGPTDVFQAVHDTYTHDEKVEMLNGINLGTGSVNLLPDGVDVKAIDGSRTMSTFETFTDQLIALVGAAIGIPAEALMGKFTSSYSASRAALLQAAQGFKTRRTWFARDFCQPVYEAWLAEAVALGRVRAKGYGTDPVLTAAWSRADWFGPTMGMIDPEKEVNGAMLRRKHGLSTGEREAAELTGTDYDDNLKQIALEDATWRANGMTPPSDSADTAGGDTE